MNCWEILGLQPGVEERDIKRRYAKLVKNCRPEDSPEAWQQLHDAYEQALRYDDEDQWQEEEEEQPINMSRGIVHPRPVMTFRAPNTFSGHPLPDVTIKSEGEFTWQAVLDIPAIINSRCSTNVQMAFSCRQPSTRNPDRN